MHQHEQTNEYFCTNADLHPHNYGSNHIQTLAHFTAHDPAVSLWPIATINVRNDTCLHDTFLEIVIGIATVGISSVLTYTDMNE